MLITRQSDTMDPTRWAYHNFFVRGEEFDEKGLTKLNVMTRNYMRDVRYNDLESMCKVTKHIAVSSYFLTRREVEKYAEQRIYVGKNSFYLFPKYDIPIDIYCKLDHQEDTYIFDSPERIDL